MTNLLQIKSICTIQLPPQEGRASVTIEDETAAEPAAELQLRFAVEGLRYTSQALGGAGCAGQKDGTHEGDEGATYTGTATIAAQNGTEEALDLEAVGA